MKISIKPGPFIRMVELVGEPVPSHKRAGTLLRLVASQGRVCVQSGGTVAEAEAAIWENGQCSVSRLQLLNALKAYRGEAELTLEADAHGLRIDGFSMPVSCYCPAAAVPAAFQIYLATDSGFVSRVGTGPLAG
jgi:hypothetical protein